MLFSTHTNIPLFRTNAACILLDSNKFADALDIARRAVAGIDANPQLKEYDIHPMAMAAEALAVFALNPRDTERRAVVAALKTARAGIGGVPGEEMMKRLAATAERLGIKTDS